MSGWLATQVETGILKFIIVYARYSRNFVSYRGRVDVRRGAHRFPHTAYGQVDNQSSKVSGAIADDYLLCGDGIGSRGRVYRQIRIPVL